MDLFSIEHGGRETVEAPHLRQAGKQGKQFLPVRVEMNRLYMQLLERRQKKSFLMCSSLIFTGRGNRLNPARSKKHRDGSRNFAVQLNFT